MVARDEAQGRADWKWGVGAGREEELTNPKPTFCPGKPPCCPTRSRTEPLAMPRAPCGDALGLCPLQGFQQDPLGTLRGHRLSQQT